MLNSEYEPLNVTLKTELFGGKFQKEKFGLYINFRSNIKIWYSKEPTGFLLGFMSSVLFLKIPFEILFSLEMKTDSVDGQVEVTVLELSPEKEKLRCEHPLGRSWDPDTQKTLLALTRDAVLP